MKKTNLRRIPGGNVADDIVRIVQRLPKYARLAWLVLKDPSLSAKQRAALMAAVGYSISPLDAIPGIIPVIGQMDDLAVVLFVLRWILRSIPADRAEEHLSCTGLSLSIIDEDMDILRRHGVRILKRAISIIGVTALLAWKLGNAARHGILRRLFKCS